MSKHNGRRHFQAPTKQPTTVGVDLAVDRDKGHVIVVIDKHHHLMLSPLEAHRLADALKKHAGPIPVDIQPGAPTP